MLTTDQKGAIAEAAVIQAAIELGLKRLAHSGREPV
jgi:hypothetical protein